MCIVYIYIYIYIYEAWNFMYNAVVGVGPLVFDTFLDTFVIFGALMSIFFDTFVIFGTLMSIFFDTFVIFGALMSIFFDTFVIFGVTDVDILRYICYFLQIRSIHSSLFTNEANILRYIRHIQRMNSISFYKFDRFANDVDILYTFIILKNEVDIV